MNVRIADHVLGDGHPPFIVGEVGINHNGSLDTALAMVGTAKDCGCDAIKYGTFKADEFCAPDDPLYRVFKSCELPDHAWKLLKREADRLGIIFFSTPQNESDLEVLLDAGVPAIKVGSDDLTNLALLESYASHGLPVIISTGMADAVDIRVAAHIVSNAAPLVVCVCTSEYPCPPAHANISRIQTLRESMPGIPIGFSDHTEGTWSAGVAAAFGAAYLEKHFTLDQAARGPDHSFSATPTQLMEWVASIRRASIAVGNGVFAPTEAELANRAKWRRASHQKIRGIAA